MDKALVKQVLHFDTLNEYWAWYERIKDIYPYQIPSTVENNRLIYGYVANDSGEKISVDIEKTVWFDTAQEVLDFAFENNCICGIVVESPTSGIFAHVGIYTWDTYVDLEYWIKEK